jgi:hypothetical protein
MPLPGQSDGLVWACQAVTWAKGHSQAAQAPYEVCRYFGYFGIY